MRQNDKDELIRFVKKNENFHHLKEDAYEVITAYSVSSELSICKNKFCTEEGFDMCVAIKELIEDGRIEGREEINRLISCLLQDGRGEDLLRSTMDREFQKKLKQEYGIKNKKRQ